MNSNPSESESTAKKETENSTQKPVQKPTEKPTEKSTQKPTGNASWFSPTNTSYYDSTSELTSNLKSDVEYAAYYYQSSGIAPSDLSFNVIAENNKIYVVYC